MGPESQAPTKLVAGAGHSLFGTDWPYTDGVWKKDGDKGAELAETYQGKELNRVLRTNALQYFPSLRARLGA